MTPKYVDAHCHIQFDQFNPDRDDLVVRMQERGVVGIVVGCDAESSALAVSLSEKHDHLCAAAGHHPNHTEVYDEQKIRELLAHPKVVAVGECGLDYFRPVEVNEEVKARQKELFKKHLALAAEFDKPLIIHARPSSAKATEGKPSYDAYHDLIDILTEAKRVHPNLRGDIHFFVGGIPEATALIALGFTLSFTAVITFARDYDGVIKSIPLESILSETDSPYVAPSSRRGERNDPLAVEEVVAKIAEIRGEDVESVRNALVANSQRLFAL